MDINGDGHLDILSGSYSETVEIKSGDKVRAGFFQTFWGQEGGSFKKAERLQGSDGNPLFINDAGNSSRSQCTRPFAVDWDSDGDLDIVSGNLSGGFFVFKGEGNGRFSPKSEKLKLSDQKQDLTIKGGHSDPFVVDWDGDGDLDILSGSGLGGVYWAENLAGKGKTPAFKELKTLVTPIGKGAKSIQPIRDLLLPGQMPEKAASTTRIWVDDLNGDGKLDLLVGDSTVLLCPVKGLSEEECARKLKELYPLDTRVHGARGLNQELWRELVKKRRALATKKEVGFVWAYIRK